MSKIIEVNESGVGIMAADGTIELELPDDVTIESSTPLVSWAQGALDAVDIQQVQAGGATKSGRTYEEVVALRSSTSESIAARAEEAAGVGIYEIAERTGSNEKLSEGSAKTQAEREG